MKNNGRSKNQAQTGAGQRHLPLGEFVRESLWDTAIISGLALVEEALEAERTALCGARAIAAGLAGLEFARSAR